METSLIPANAPSPREIRRIMGGWRRHILMPTSIRQRVEAATEENPVLRRAVLREAAAGSPEQHPLVIPVVGLASLMPFVAQLSSLLPPGIANYVAPGYACFLFVTMVGMMGFCSLRGARLSREYAPLLPNTSTSTGWPALDAVVMLPPAYAEQALQDGGMTREDIARIGALAEAMKQSKTQALVGGLAQSHTSVVPSSEGETLVARARLILGLETKEALAYEGPDHGIATVLENAGIPLHARMSAA